jgi:putative addiction module killer protein
VIKIRQTDEYARWFDKLRDTQARARILVRVRRLSLGNAGDVQPIGEGVSELRIDYGPGYRIYFKSQEKTVNVLLIGGNKRTQKRDIERAKELARDL